MHDGIVATVMTDRFHCDVTLLARKVGGYVPISPMLLLVAVHRLKTRQDFWALWTFYCESGIGFDGG